MARFVAALVVFLAFTLYSVEVIFAEGYLAFLEVPMQGGWALQITLDLVVAASIATMWLVPDAKKRGITTWPFLATLPFLGSISLLAYLVLREWKLARPRETALSA
jgi:hypothetical protein